LTPTEGISITAPSLACAPGAPFAVRLTADTHGCFGGVGIAVELERFETEAVLQTSRWSRRLSLREADEILVALDQTLMEPEVSMGGSSTTRIEAELEVRCADTLETARWAGNDIDASDLDDLAEHEGAMRTRGTFARPNALFRLVDSLADAAEAPAGR
jgi:hypothetical protein